MPVGGRAEIKIHLTPNAVMKFDTRVQVAIKGLKTLELRMGGTVETPCVDIDIVSFWAEECAIFIVQYVFVLYYQVKLPHFTVAVLIYDIIFNSQYSSWEECTVDQAPLFHSSS